MIRLGLATALVLGLATAADARCRGWSALKNAYFGDLHVHTAYSLDAYQFGTRTEPAAAYAFATGASVKVGEGFDAAHGELPGPVGYRIDRSGGPLDFATVTDHGEWLATDYGCTVDRLSPFYGSPFCVALRAFDEPPQFERPCFGFTDVTGQGCADVQRTAWLAERHATELANDPCRFTTFHAYEWTKVAGEGLPQTLHKNVYFRGADVPAAPLDAIDYPTAQELWAGLAAQCNGVTGCEAMTIPHNSNESQGHAFDVEGFAAGDLNRMLAYQRLVEIHQHKGNSECVTDTADGGAVAACDFEVIPPFTRPEDAPGYVRPALEAGLVRRATRGYTPVPLGFVGATDTHDGTPGAVAEQGWAGHLGARDDTPERRVIGPSLRPHDNPGGLTGVWAEENSREALWAALRRREVFATSGPRIRVRMYAWNGEDAPCADPGFPAGVVRRGGVPMGGTLARADGAPRFVVYALQDRTPLAAVDVVKGTVVDGAPVERVTTLALDRPPYCVTWTDPDFDGAAPTFWYARVREQPTWRWSHWDCAAVRAAHPADWPTRAPRCLLPASEGGVDVQIEERAWTSPIWYLPGGPVTVPVTRLTLRGGAGGGADAGARFTFRSTTARERDGHRIVPPPAGAGGDPTAGGAVLEVYNPDGREHARVVLPAEGWRRTRRGWRYADPGGVVQRVVVAPDRVGVRAGGAAWPFTLDEPFQGAVAVRLALGDAAPWCTTAPARRSRRRGTTAANDRPGRFAAAAAPPPEQCPLVASASGAFVEATAF